MLSNIYIVLSYTLSMDTSALENIGLSATEVKVFIIILELGESKAGKIIERTGLQSSSAYNAINSLIEKGFVSYIKKSQVKYYRAVNPETVLDYIELKKREYLKLLPELKAKQKRTIEEGVEFYKSFTGIKALLIELIKDAKRGDIYRTFSVEDSVDYEKAREHVFRSVKQLQKEKRLVMKGIFHERTRYAPTKTSIMQKRYLNAPMPPNTMIVNDKVAVISWKNEPSGILIHSKDISQSYSDFFDHMWSLAKK